MRRIFPPKAAGSLPHQSPYYDVAFPEPPEGRPYAYVNMAMTLDGRVVTGNPKSGFLLSGSEGDRRGMAELRARADAVMIGAGTMRTENPVLHVRYDDLLHRRIAEGRSENPRYIIVTNSGKLDPHARLFFQSGVLIITNESGERAFPDELRPKVEIMVAGTTEVNLKDAVRRLRQEHDVRYLLIEGGPTLTHAALEEGCVDEFFLTIAPLMKSGTDVPTLLEGPAFPYGSLPRFCLHTIAEDGGELFLRYGRDAREE